MLITVLKYGLYLIVGGKEAEKETDKERVWGGYDVQQGSWS